LRDFAPLAIFSSQLKRAVQTAEIIKEYAEIPGEITKKDFLQDFFYEIDGHKKESQAVAFLKSLTEKYPGEQVVVVSHLNPIMEIISELGFADEEISSWQDVKSYSKEPLKMSQGYRIVFAGDVPVECVKVNPAGV
jgi:broad specificity phosphatase PhoE